MNLQTHFLNELTFFLQGTGVAVTWTTQMSTMTFRHYFHSVDLYLSPRLFVVCTCLMFLILGRFICAETLKH